LLGLHDLNLRDDFGVARKYLAGADPRHFKTLALISFSRGMPSEDVSGPCGLVCDTLPSTFFARSDVVIDALVLSRLGRNTLELSSSLGCVSRLLNLHTPSRTFTMSS